MVAQESKNGGKVSEMIQVNLTQAQMLKIAQYVVLGPDIENAGEKLGRLKGMLYHGEYSGQTGRGLTIWLCSLMEDGRVNMESCLETMLLNLSRDWTGKLPESGLKGE